MTVKWSRIITYHLLAIINRRFFIATPYTPKQDPRHRPPLSASLHHPLHYHSTRIYDCHFHFITINNEPIFPFSPHRTPATAPPSLRPSTTRHGGTPTSDSDSSSSSPIGWKTRTGTGETRTWSLRWSGGRRRCMTGTGWRIWTGSWWPTWGRTGEGIYGL